MGEVEGIEVEKMRYAHQLTDSQRFRFVSDLDEIGHYEVFYQDPEKGTVSEKPKARS
ncbi:MAG: hypothetical protein M1113_00070 [Candidatus Thermoplasmatota archaeon]|nr:hypothetical protein [Candidatus Thermoplasmatota archaeon]